MKNLHITLTGKVYKVGLRYFIKQMAKHYGIVGTVRYRDDTTIAINASGNKEKMDRFLTFCKLGCPGSDIDNMSIHEKEIADFKSFDIVE